MKRRALELAALALLAMGCNSKTITAIEIVPLEDQVVEVGAELQFTVNATFDDDTTGRIPEFDVLFTSSNADVVAISGSGTAEGVSLGTARVRAVHEALRSNEVDVTVVPATVEPDPVDGGT